jgi:hypothetical protein
MMLNCVFAKHEALVTRCIVCTTFSQPVGITAMRWLECVYDDEELLMMSHLREIAGTHICSAAAVA